MAVVEVVTSVATVVLVVVVDGEAVVAGAVVASEVGLDVVEEAVSSGEESSLLQAAKRRATAKQADKALESVLKEVKFFISWITLAERKRLIGI